MDQREKNTDEFLTSYSVRQLLSTVSGYDEDETHETTAGIELSPPRPFHTELACGQIRLLKEVRTITYIVLLEKRGDAYVTIPFSHYDSPATDRELRTEYDGGMYLNVLQTWNVQTIPCDALKESWLVSELPQADCEDACAFIHEQALPERLLQKTGTPIADEDDIRHLYMEEERDVFRHVDSAEAAHRRGSAFWFNQVAIPEVWAPAALSLAAGPEQRNIFVECRVEGFTECITVEYAPHEEKLRIKVYNALKEDYSAAFDGWNIIDANAAALGVIDRGRCVIKNLRRFDGQCALRNPEGRIYVFEKNA